VISIDAGLKTAIDNGEAMYPLLIAVREGNNYATDNAEGDFISIANGGTDKAVKSYVVKTVPAQNGTPTPSSPIAITGSSATAITREGKNLFTLSPGRNAYTWTADGVGFSAIAANTSSITFHGTATANRSFAITGQSFTLPAGTYVASLTVYNKLQVSIIGNGVTLRTLWNTSVSFTLSVSTVMTFQYVVRNGAAFGSSETVGIQIERDAVATAYEDCVTPEVSTITYPSGAGTVYGADIDATDGVLRKTYTSVMASELTWSKFDASRNVYQASLPGKKSGSANLLTTKFAVSSAVIAQLANGQCRGSDYTDKIYCGSDETTIETWNTWVSTEDFEIVYEIETPVSYTFSPITITTVRNNNTMWASVGTSYVTYYTDVIEANVKVFTASDIWMGKFAVDRYATNGNAPSIGTTISAECNFSLRYNADYLQWLAEDSDLCMFVGCRSYWDYDEELPEINTGSETPTGNYIYVGMDTTTRTYGHLYSASGTDLGIPIVPLGVFSADKIKTSPTTIEVRGLDVLDKLDTIVTGARLGTTTPDQEVDSPTRNCEYIPFDVMVQKIAEYAGVSGLTITYRNLLSSDRAWYPYGGVTGKKTFRQVLQYIAQLSGMIFLAPANKRRRIGGKYFSVSQIPSVLDVTPSVRYSMTVNSVDTVTLASIGVSDGSEEYIAAGSADGVYSLMVADNPWVRNAPTTDIKQDYADALGYLLTSIYRLTFTPFEASIIQRPDLELYDPVTVYDANGDPHISAVTHISYKLNGPTEISCAGDNIQSGIVSSSTSASAIKRDAISDISRGVSKGANLAWRTGSKSIALKGYTIFAITLTDGTNDWTLPAIRNGSDIYGSLQVQSGTSINSYRVHFSTVTETSAMLDYACVGPGTSTTSLTVKSILALI